MSTEIEMVATVTIDASDDAPRDWLSRVATADFPYKRLGGQPMTEREGLVHLAYNAVANGVEDASRLDGWADLDSGIVTMRVGNVEDTP
jgi:hypothetical protein